MIVLSSNPLANSQSLQLRPPAVSQRSWTRWVAVDNAVSGASSWIQQVNQALAAGPADASLDDPAVGGYFFELLGRFPDSVVQTSVGPIFWPLAPGTNPTPLKKAQATPAPIVVKWAGAGAAGLALSAGVMTVTVPKGQIWELRISAAARRDVAELRFAAELLKGARATDASDGTQSRQWLLGAPLRFLVETATDETARDGDYLLSVGATPGPTVQAVLAAPTTAHVTQSAADEARRRLRYVGTVAPQVQRWTWSGRPLPPPRDNDLAAWELLAYEGRDDDDALALPAVRLQRAHLATSVPLVVQPAPQPNGVGHWRMRVALQSRYAILGEAAGTPQTKWTDAGVATLTPSPTQAPALTPPTQHTVLAPLMRPSIDLALPLTSALAAANATVAADPSLPPPLMLMLNQQVFADGDVSDRIEIGLEAARHPDPDWTPTSPPPPTPPAPTSHPRYWPQIAPDPRLLGTGHDGSPVAMRLLGPVGWTLDTSVLRPSYPRASLLLAFLQPPPWDAGGAWPMLKIRARRFQEPDVDIGTAGAPQPQPLPFTSPSLPPTDPGAGFCLELQGVISQAAPLADLVLQPSPVTDPSHAWRLRVSRLDDDHIEVSATLELVSGTVDDSSRIRSLTLPSKALDTVRLRVVVGKRDAPPTVGGRPPPPAWDISAAVSRPQDLKRDQTDGSSGWIVLPIFTLSGVQIAQANWDGGLVVQGASNPGGMNWTWRFLRISACTDGVWVQFGADAASLRLIGDQTCVLATSLFACVRGADGTISLSLPDGAESAWVARSTSPVALAPRTIAGNGVSAPATLYAVVTAEVFDAAGQPSEQPLGVFRVAVSSLASGQAVAAWSLQTGAVDLSQLKGGGGRLRFLSVEEQPPFDWNQPDPDSPFLPVTRLFDATPVAGTKYPDDGVGRIIAISPPIDIGV